jgi:hypothetical protein
VKSSESQRAYRKNRSPPSSGMNICSSEKSVNFYRITWRYSPVTIQHIRSCYKCKMLNTACDIDKNVTVSGDSLFKGVAFLNPCKTIRNRIIQKLFFTERH